MQPRNKSWHRGPEHFVKRARAISRANARKIAEHHHYVADLSARVGWNDYRPLSEMTGLWGRHVQVLPLLKRVAAKKNKRLSILEDGPGKGVIIRELKAALAQEGIRAKVDAITLHRSELDDSARKAVRRLYVGKAEYVAPTRQYDCIISNVGSIAYVHPLLRKEHVLKLAHSLAPGGHMLAMFYYAGAELASVLPPSEKYGTIIGNILQRASTRSMSVLDQMRAIERAFEKQGFDAKFYELNREEDIWGLHVERLNKKK